MSGEKKRLTRREFAIAAGAAAATVAWGRGAEQVVAETGRTDGDATPVFRFVHLADIHVQPELKADEGFRKCMRKVHELNPRPDFILTGGDLVMDVLEVGESRAKSLFDLYTGICNDSDIPLHHCVGNHDVFGWVEKKSGVTPDHAAYGKEMVKERLEMDRTTYSFDHKGWHFVVLDDIQPAGNEKGYIGGVSEADLDWLTKDLEASAGMPTMLCTHIPIVTAVAFHTIDALNEPDITISKRLVCSNAKPVMELLRRHGVKGVLTGHLHQNERTEFGGTTFIGQGAVSGSWWKGAHHGNPEGFGILDVYADGRFEHQYQTYGWEAVG